MIGVREQNEYGRENHASVSFTRVCTRMSVYVSRHKTVSGSSVCMKLHRKPSRTKSYHYYNAVRRQIRTYFSKFL